MGVLDNTHVDNPLVKRELIIKGQFMTYIIKLILFDIMLFLIFSHAHFNLISPSLSPPLLIKMLNSDKLVLISTTFLTNEGLSFQKCKKIMQNWK